MCRCWWVWLQHLRSNRHKLLLRCLYWQAVVSRSARSRRLRLLSPVTIASTAPAAAAIVATATIPAPFVAAAVAAAVATVATATASTRVSVQGQRCAGMRLLCVLEPGNMRCHELVRVGAGRSL